MAAIFLQKRGRAIGTRMAPAYANLFMHHLESQLLNLAPLKPIFASGTLMIFL